MSHQPDYKTLPGGSIDYAHYLACGQVQRSNSFHAMLSAIAGVLTRRFKAADLPAPGPSKPPAARAGRTFRPGPETVQQSKQRRRLG